MSYASLILPDFEPEMANTRKVLERVPEDKLDWQPHPTSHTIGWNANHLAEMPGWVRSTMSETVLDIAPVNGPRYQSPSLRQRQQILDLFDKNVAEAKEALAKANEADYDVGWSLVKAGQPMFTMPRRAVLRSFVVNHIVHHREVLCVYLRLNNIPVPGMYGPSGDE
jgi:uncharacterized damage-inducible protein DinB